MNVLFEDGIIVHVKIEEIGNLFLQTFCKSFKLKKNTSQSMPFLKDQKKKMK